MGPGAVGYGVLVWVGEREFFVLYVYQFCISSVSAWGLVDGTLDLRSKGLEFD